MFKVNDTVFYAGYGLVKVKRIDSRVSDEGVTKKYYVFQVLYSGMTILMPIEKTEGNVRKLITKTKANQVLRYLKSPGVIENTDTWNRRYRVFMEMIKTGEVDEIANVVKQLTLLKMEKDLSFGERKMLDCASSMLEDELKEVLGVHEAFSLSI